MMCVYLIMLSLFIISLQHGDIWYTNTHSLRLNLSLQTQKLRWFALTRPLLPGILTKSMTLNATNLKLARILPKVNKFDISQQQPR